MDSSKKIAFIVNDTDFFLSHRIPLAKRCQELFEIVIVLPKSPKNQKVKDEGFRVIELPLSRKGTNPLNEMRTIYHLFRILRREKPDFVHNFTIKPALYGSLASRWAGVPNIIITITGLGYVYVTDSMKGQTIRPIVDFLYKWAFQTPKVRVIFQNPDDQDLFTSENHFIPEYRTTVIPGSGVDPERFFPENKESKNEIKVLVPCRMLWDKGVGEVVKALEKIQSPLPIKICLAGKTDPGNPAAIPEKTLRAWKENPAIDWLGHVADMNKLYNACDIICLPSYREGLPLALLEASLCAKPIVTTDVPGCNFLVQNEENGLVVPVKDPTALAVAISRLAKDPQLREKLGNNARNKALANYTCDSINDKILGFYKEQ